MKRSVIDTTDLSVAEVQQLLDTVSTLQEKVKELTSKNIELESKKMVFDLSSTTSYSSVDLLKRVSRLEEIVYNK